MQSLSRRENVQALIDRYGQVIVDECHHVGAVSIESLLKLVKARFVLGLTATPIRREGLQPIIFMQCGPLRYTAQSPVDAPQRREVVACRILRNSITPQDTGIQGVFRHLVEDEERTAVIVQEAVRALDERRKILLLTERTKHLSAIHEQLKQRGIEPFVLQGRTRKTERDSVIASLNALDPLAPRLLLATGGLVGEGFDHPPLDTLLLAFPVSWKGTLQQYAGRLHREHNSKDAVRIIDFVDAYHPALARMWEKRQRGYRAMGYQISEDGGFVTESLAL